MSSTKLQLRDQIKQEARVKTGTNLNGLIDSIVQDILRDYGLKSRYYEVLLENVAVTTIAATGTYTLPANFQALDNVQFGVGPSARVFRTLLPQSEHVRRAYAGGHPRFFRLIAGPKLSLFPFEGVATTDTLRISYYADPASLFLLDTDVFPIPRLESAVKKDAIARVQRFHSASTEAQMTDADSKGSWIAAQSSDQ